MTGAIGIFCSQRVPEMLDGIGDHRRSLFEWHRLKARLSTILSVISGRLTSSPLVARVSMCCPITSVIWQCKHSSSPTVSEILPSLRFLNLVIKGFKS